MKNAQYVELNTGVGMAFYHPEWMDTLWYSGYAESSFPLGIGEPGFLVSDQSRHLFFFPIVGEVSIKLSHP